jgi:hypothetical protein
MITQYSVVLCSGQPGCSLSRSLANYCRMRVNPPNSPTAYRGTHTASGAMNVSGLTHFCATDTKVLPKTKSRSIPTKSRSHKIMLPICGARCGSLVNRQCQNIELCSNHQNRSISLTCSVAPRN